MGPAALMNDKAGNVLRDSLLIKDFNEFYRELVPLIRHLEQVSSSESRPMTAAAITRRISGIFERQMSQARRHGGEYGAGIYREAQYAMAALADEYLLHTEWHGRETWNQTLFEFNIFGTRSAGETYFEKVDQVLEDGNNANPELALLYLTILSLDFLGRFRGSDPERKIQMYKNALFGLVYRREPDFPKTDRELLFGEAYGKADVSSADLGPKPAFWLAALTLMVIVFLVLSHTLWGLAIADIDTAIEGIFKRSREINNMVH